MRRPARRTFLAILFVAALNRPGVADDMPRETSIPAAAAAGEALLRAEEVINAARNAGNVWLATPRRFAEARAAAERGAWAHAIAMAERARREASLALNQAHIERARYLLDTRADIDPDARTAVRGLLTVHDGAAALRVLEDAGAAP